MSMLTTKIVRAAAAAVGVVVMTTFGYATLAGADPVDNRRGGSVA